MVEAIGWLGTAIFVASFLFKDRTHLHVVGIVGAAVKLVYTLHYGLMPLAVNWVLVILSHAYNLGKSRTKSQ
jgi:hypothetical protein